MGKPVLDVCMIVRDEQQALPGALASLHSLRSLIGRICVYDTGSADETVSLARAAGCRVEAGFWDDDFARARNASLAMAGAPWALIVDADDEVVADPEALRRFLRRRDLDVAQAHFTHLDGAGVARSTSKRFALVRRDRVRFVGAVHEVPARSSGVATTTELVEPGVLVFLHRGYADAATRQRKARRNLSSAELAVQQARASGEPGALAQALFHRGRTRLVLGDDDQAAADLIEAFARARAADAALRFQIALEAAQALLRSSQPERAVQLAEDVGRYESGAQLARLILGLVLADAGEAARALDVLLSVPDIGDPKHGVTPGALNAARLRAARACGRADEVLARLVVSVGRDHQVEVVPHLMDAWGDQPPDVLAQLISEVAPVSGHLGSVREALRLAGDAGRSVAARL